MKTNTNNQNSGLGSKSAQLSSTETKAPESAVAPVAKPDNRLPIDTEARKANRMLPTPKVLNALFTKSPDIYRLAEVVGKWVWVRFKEQPAAEIRQQLAQLGFHWNNTRQTWQHPCGTRVEERADYDPRKRYGSYFAAQQKHA
jgi:hypothetical protein